jgi:thiamine-phosphate pyrophosphorylase
MDRTPLIKKLRLMLVASQAEAFPRPLEHLSSLAFIGGAGALQLREKHLSGRELFDEAMELRTLCRKEGKLFIVNDRLDVALACQADGVHLGQEDLPAREAVRLMPKNMLLGVSVNTRAMAEEALTAGADYLGVGAIFSTPSKPEAKAISPKEIEAILALGAPTLAIGGIGPKNAAVVWAYGFSGLAVISALTQAENPANTARELLKGAPG